MSSGLPDVAPGEVALRVSAQPVGRAAWAAIEPNSALQTNDRFRIELVSHEPLYLYVLRAENGNASLLYPLGEVDSQKPQSHVTLPQDSDFYTLKPPAGLEDVRAVASRQPLSAAAATALAMPEDVTGQRFPPPILPEKKRDPYSVRTRLNAQGTAALRFTFTHR
jgi:hypothetical protein